MMKRGIIFVIGVLLLSVPRASVGWTATDELLNVLPDGMAVVTLDVQRLSSSPAWGRITAASPVKGVFDRIDSEASRLGLRLSDLTAVSIVFMAPSFDQFVASGRGTFNSDDLLAGLRASDKLTVTAETYKGQEVYNLQPAAAQSKPSSLVFYPSGVFAIGSPAGVRGSIDVWTGSVQGVSGNSELVAALSESQNRGLRFAIRMNAETAKRFESSNVPLPGFSTLRMVFGSADLTTGLDVNAVLRNATSDEAKMMAGQLNGVLAMAQAYLGGSQDARMVALNEALKSLTIEASDIDVKINGVLPEELLAQVFK